MPQAYIIARSAISYRRYIIRSQQERISLKKAAHRAAPFLVFSFNDIPRFARYDIRLRRMIYLLCKYDIISVPHMPQAYIIARSAISYRRYIIRSRQERISLKKAARWAAPFLVFSFNDISRSARYDIRLRRMIYLLRKYDIISVPHMPQAYIIRSVQERISLKKAAHRAAFFYGTPGENRTHN